ncbi:general secretion pathway protein GspH [Stenotrophomonas daejeonensis]|uniref:Type II secretion system protein H n=2 Tax=Stenotrophomonas daejeonensis TaxID=659018 RepID=A0A0R0DNH1_9GAMM|nr:GspH/FimT family pseudopilin [Stenotrophomonas daejeonensis]KRG82992.1 general secretion pathway protein GspH [Stenotrophomonas daejeonensis]
MHAPAHRLARPSSVRQRAATAGFTLLEMLLVLTLIAATVGMAAMAMSGGLEGVRLRGVAKEITAQLRYTRARAIASGQPQRFLIDVQGRTWQAANGRRGTIPPTLSLHFTGAREAQLRADEAGVLFFPDGASTGGRVRLRARDSQWRIDVAWLTGEVSLRQEVVQ